MANRSYLFATDHVPSIDCAKSRGKPVGISEFNYDIPFVFKLLLSGQPRACRSIIWDLPDEIAIAGDYAQGVAALQKFLDRIEQPEIEPFKQEAQEFLMAEANRRQYFILECGEIFDMYKDPMAELNAILLHEIEDIEPSIESVLSSLSTVRAQSEPAKYHKFIAWFTGLIRRPVPPADPLDPYYHLGLGFWDNVLFYSPAGVEE